MGKELSTEVVNSVVEEIEACFVEGQYNASLTIIETYHTIGRILREASTKTSITDLIEICAKKTEINHKKLGERSLWFAVKLYDNYKDLDTLPEGKNITLTMMKKQLSDPKEDKGCSMHGEEIINIEYCGACNKRMN